MLFIPMPGVALLVPTPIPGKPDLKHLHVLLTGALQSGGNGGDSEVVLVSMSSVRQGVPHDSSCILNVGDHANVEWPSYLAYQRAATYSVTQLQDGLDSCRMFLRPTFEDMVLERIVRGAIISLHTPRKIKKLVQAAHPTVKLGPPAPLI